MKNINVAATLVLVFCVVLEVSTGGGGKNEKIHFKIQVPKFVNKQYHTKTIYIHVHEPPKVQKHNHHHEHEHEHHHAGGGDAGHGSHGHGHSYHHTHHTSTHHAHDDHGSHHSHHDDHGTHHTTHHHGSGGHDRSGSGGAAGGGKHHGHGHHKPHAPAPKPHHHPQKPKGHPHHGHEHPHHVPHKPPPKKPPAKHPSHPHHHHPHHHGHHKPKPHHHHHSKPVPKPPTHKHPVVKPVHEHHPAPHAPPPKKGGHEHIVHKQNYEYNAEYNDDYTHNPYYYQQIEAETPFYETVEESLEDHSEPETEVDSHAGLYQDYSANINHGEEVTTPYPEEIHHTYQNNYENIIPNENEPGFHQNPYLSAYIHGTPDINQFQPSTFYHQEALTDGNVIPKQVTYDSYGNIISEPKKQNDPYNNNYIYPPAPTNNLPPKNIPFPVPTSENIYKSEYNRYENAEKQIEQDFHIDAASLNHSIVYDRPPSRKSNKKNRGDSRHGSRYRPG